MMSADIYALENEIIQLRKSNAELLAALRELRDDETVPGRFLPQISKAIAKAEARK